MKFCVDCKHYEDRLCLASSRYYGINLVTGKPNYEPPTTAAMARYDKLSCGEEAKLFEPKPFSLKKTILPDLGSNAAYIAIPVVLVTLAIIFSN